ncbi:hypothetical protein SCALM49S_05742 [Streptomyces californicus]
MVQITAQPRTQGRTASGVPAAQALDVPDEIGVRGAPSPALARFRCLRGHGLSSDRWAAVTIFSAAHFFFRRFIALYGSFRAPRMIAFALVTAFAPRGVRVTESVTSS